MATLSDILDWLNQGGQGDIPGTGGAGADSPSASAQPQAQAAPQPTPAAATPAATTPDGYADEIPELLRPQYDALVRGGMSPQMAHMLLTQGQQGEQQGQKSQTGGQKQGGLQGSPGYQAGQQAGAGLEHLFFGAPPTQQNGQTQTHQGFMDWLNNWFSGGQ